MYVGFFWNMNYLNVSNCVRFTGQTFSRPGVVGCYNLLMVYLNELCHENSNLGNCQKMIKT